MKSGKGREKCKIKTTSVKCIMRSMQTFAPYGQLPYGNTHFLTKQVY